MLAVEVFTSLSYRSCTYVVSRPGMRESLVIDPGDPNMAESIKFLEYRNMTAGTVVLTHEHHDHIAGVSVLRDRCGSRLVCSRACAEGIGDPKRNFSRYLTGVDYSSPPADATCEDLGWRLGWSDLDVQFVPTPGHSPGSICIAIGPNLFTGDTLIRDTRTVTKLPGGDKRALDASIKSILRTFPGDTRVYPGHGEGFFLRDVGIETTLKNRA
jgi:hydroxyacylglutathione hydrolase